MAHNVGPIQVALAGLYGMLGVKDGSNPDVITGFVQPVLDAIPWWLRATREQVVQPDDIVATGALQGATWFQVPENQWWYMHNGVATAEWDPTAIAPEYNVLVAVTDQLSRTVWSSQLFENDRLDQMRIGNSARAQVSIDGLWLPPGSQCIWQFYGAAPDHLVLAPVYASRCRV